jgi:protein-S-isoprenylcysteine O-methyltransferase Ste14
MARVLVLLFGVVTYMLFLFTFLYQIGFLGGFIVPKNINDPAGTVFSETYPAAINVLLLSLFAIQHTIMARLAFKRWWTTIVPVSIERSIFVLLTSILLLLMNWQWQPLTEVVWHIDSSIGRNIVYAISFLGWGIVLYATFCINHFDLFGLRQVWLYSRGIPYTQLMFKENVLYLWVRHPLMLGFIVAFWATPNMTQGHLLFTVVTTVYILIAIQIEERTLVGIHGDEYRKYQDRVSMIIPMPPKSRT